MVNQAITRLKDKADLHLIHRNTLQNNVPSSRGRTTIRPDSSVLHKSKKYTKSINQDPNPIPISNKPASKSRKDRIEHQTKDKILTFKCPAGVPFNFKPTNNQHKPIYIPKVENQKTGQHIDNRNKGSRGNTVVRKKDIEIRKAINEQINGEELRRRQYENKANDEYRRKSDKIEQHKQFLAKARAFSNANKQLNKESEKIKLETRELVNRKQNNHQSNKSNQEYHQEVKSTIAPKQISQSNQIQTNQNNYLLQQCQVQSRGNSVNLTKITKTSNDSTSNLIASCADSPSKSHQLKTKNNPSDLTINNLLNEIQRDSLTNTSNKPPFNPKNFNQHDSVNEDLRKASNNQYSKCQSDLQPSIILPQQYVEANKESNEPPKCTPYAPTNQNPSNKSSSLAYPLPITPASPPPYSTYDCTDPQSKVNKSESIYKPDTKTQQNNKDPIQHLGSDKNKIKIPKKQINFANDDKENKPSLDFKKTSDKNEPETTKKLDKRAVVPSKPPLGLENIGNSCYMNSILQCMLANPLILQTLSANVNTSSKTKGKLAETLKKIIESRKSKQQIEINDLKNLKSYVSSYNERFNGYSQEDAAEFVSTLMTGIGNELESKRVDLTIEKEDIINKRIEQIKGTKEADILKQSLNEVVEIEANGNSDFMNLFRAQIYSEIVCKGGCNFKETCFEDRIMMELDIPKGKDDTDLNKCFERTFEEVLYTEENDNFCEKCDKITCFTRKEWISRLPKIMIIHLKRFETNNYGEQQRNNKSIEFPIKDLNVSDRVHRYFREFYNESYNLHGVSIHYGTLHGGHYTANIKNMTEDGKWYNCDDAFTREIDLPKTSERGPYVLFYHRQDAVNVQD